jgi:hypothetical protein
VRAADAVTLPLVAAPGVGGVGGGGGGGRMVFVGSVGEGELGHGFPQGMEQLRVRGGMHDGEQEKVVIKANCTFSIGKKYRK